MARQIKYKHQTSNLVPTQTSIDIQYLIFFFMCSYNIPVGNQNCNKLCLQTVVSEAKTKVSSKSNYISALDGTFHLIIGVTICTKLITNCLYQNWARKTRWGPSGQAVWPFSHAPKVSLQFFIFKKFTQNYLLMTCFILIVNSAKYEKGISKCSIKLRTGPQWLKKRARALCKMAAGVCCENNNYC